jgi:peptide methionine sulfoxide reductase msrA/msrB
MELPATMLLLREELKMKRAIASASAVILLCAGCTAAVQNDSAPQASADTETAQSRTLTKEMEMEIMDFSKEKENVIYMAGGCFWGMEKLMQSIPGVIDVKSGYANGSGEKEANYQTVSMGRTGFKETVRVEYDPDKVSLDALLMAYFYVIDPTVTNRQGNDIGFQYQTGVYYTNEKAKETVERIAKIEEGRVDKFAVEIGPLINFYPAEEYHQNYLEKNPNGYCHIPTEEIEIFSHLKIDPGDYQRPADEVIKQKLTDTQYAVTQKGATERAFTNPYWDFMGKGIYVDVVTGEPLFSSKDKFKSSCGWPSFSAPIEGPSLIYRKDMSLGLERTEVRSRAGDSHLGHVFKYDPESPNGTRYCINGASLRFVPYDQMDEQGYGDLKKIFD